MPIEKEEEVEEIRRQEEEKKKQQEIEEKERKAQKIAVKQVKRFKEDLYKEAKEAIEKGMSKEQAEAYLIELRKILDRFKKIKKDEQLVEKENKTKETIKKLEKYLFVYNTTNKLIKELEDKPKYAKLIGEALKNNKRWADIRKELSFIDEPNILKDLRILVEDRKTTEEVMKQLDTNIASFFEEYGKELSLKDYKKAIEFLKSRKRTGLAKEIEKMPKAAQIYIVKKLLPAILKGGMWSESNIKLLEKLLNKLNSKERDILAILGLFRNFMPKLSKIVSDLRGVSILIGMAIGISRMIK